MAIKSLEIVLVLRKTAEAIAQSTDYQWGHMGSCNCGFLARQITRYTRDEIHSRAMQRYGDWSEQLNDYCPNSGLLMDDLIGRILSFGFNREDLRHLERLSDSMVLQSIPIEKRFLRHNVKKDVVLYLQTWADQLEASVLSEVQLTSLEEALLIPASQTAEQHTQNSL